MIVKEISKQEMEVVSQLHKKIFPDYFLTNLGHKILTNYYQAFLEGKDSVFLGGYTETCELVGFVLITTTYAQTLNNFYYNNSLILAFQILRNCIGCNQTILSGLKARVLKLIKKRSKLNIKEDSTALLSIGVAPEFRSTGIAAELVETVEKILMERNVSSYGLSVKKENLRAKHFYEKKGFVKMGETTDLEYYRKALVKSAPIRILHLPDTLSKRSGVMSVIMNYYRNINRKNIQFDFVCFETQNANYIEEITALGGKIYIVNTDLKNSLIRLNKWIKEFLFNEATKYTAVHYHAISIWGLFLKNFSRAGINHVVAHSHTTRFSDKKKNCFRNKLLCLPLKRQSNHWVACSHAAGEFLYGKKAVEEGQVKVIKNAIDCKKYSYNQKARIEMQKKFGLQNRLVIGHVGRFAAPKNHKFLVEIFNEIKRIKPDAILMLIGDGDLQASIKEQVRANGLEGNVLFLGQRNDVHDLMQAMDVFVLPSLFEGLGIVAIEAQASGLPCLFSEGVPQETGIIDYKYSSLKQSAHCWAKQAIELAEQGSRSDTTFLMRHAGYNIFEEALEMEQFYQGLR